jgi:putative holliday junction resolvase
MQNHIILGVDYGDHKIGLSVAYALMAEPLKVVATLDEVINEIKKNEATKIVIGVSEGESAEKAKAFGKNLQERLPVEIIFQDETLSTQEAQILSQEAGIGRKKRQGMEDAYAATIILQSYLDSL